MELTSVLFEISCIFLVGVLSGFLGSLFGIGGGLISTPIITIAFGLDIKYSIGASIIVVIATSSGAAVAYLKDNVLNLRAAMFLELFTSIGGVCGALLIGVFSPFILYLLFALMIIISIFNTIKKIYTEKNNLSEDVSPSKASLYLNLNNSYYDDKLKRYIKYNVTNVGLGSIIMFGAGIASGLLGIGSGIFKVIALDSVMKMPLKVSSATSNLMMGVTAAASSIVYFIRGQILPQIAAPLSLGVVLGALIGSRVMPKLEPRLIRILFVPIMLFFSVQMIIKAFMGV